MLEFGDVRLVVARAVDPRGVKEDPTARVARDCVREVQLELQATSRRPLSRPVSEDRSARHRCVSLLHLAAMPWARIGELVGHDDLVTTARTYTHVVADEREVDYTRVLQ
jgi:hypothetical protein